MKKLGIPNEQITRVSAIYNEECGALGCSQSHAKAIKLFLESPYERCIIFEDDFVPKKEEWVSFFEKMKAYTNEGWNLIQLSGNILSSCETSIPFLQKAFHVQTSSSYLLQKRFAPTLLENIEEGIRALQAQYSDSCCIDIYWLPLQINNLWFISEPFLGYQRESYSDILKRVTKYGV
jgi:GR25 family glycosyltransferase involved in LPS biosynthesis